MNTFRIGLRYKLSLLLVIMLLAALLEPTSASAATDPFTVNQTLPFYLLAYIPCAAGGSGEFVELTGNLHDLLQVAFDETGGFHVTVSDNPQGVSGYGLTTGDSYQATGIARIHINGTIGLEATTIRTLSIIGQGTGNNFLMHETYHITINANGTLTAFVDNFSFECK